MKEILLINISKTEFENIIKNLFLEIKKEILDKNNKTQLINQINQEKEKEIEYIKEKDLAKMLGLNKITLYHWRKQGKIKFKKIGRLIYYDKNEIHRIFK